MLAEDEPVVTIENLPENKLQNNPIMPVEDEPVMTI
jgi:hypothetical protein